MLALRPWTDVWDTAEAEEALDEQLALAHRLKRLCNAGNLSADPDAAATARPTATAVQTTSDAEAACPSGPLDEGEPLNM